MYKIYCDNELIFDLSNDTSLISPILKLQDNNAGTLEFSIVPGDVVYDKIKKMKSEIKVLSESDDKPIFEGRPIDETIDFKNCKKVTCEGALAYLNDSIQRPSEYHNLSIRAYLETLIRYHNLQVSDDRLKFKVGIVTVHDDNDSIYKYTNWETTLQVIKTDLVDKYGGHLRVRIEGGIKYLDYLKDYPRTNTQVIEFGTNLLDFTKNIDATQIVTAVIPLGARLEESSIKKLEERVTIKSVNNNLDYIASKSAVDTYGWIFKTVTWDNVHKPEILKHKGEEYLKSIQFEKVVLKVKAIDLHMVNVDIEQIQILDEIRVISKPNGLDKIFPVTELTIDMCNPQANTITLGQSGIKAMSGSAVSSNAEIMKRIDDMPSVDYVVQEAVKNATEILNNALNGHVVKCKDELLIMDTADLETAKKVWRWNLNGLAYSNNGYKGPYETAITMDGSIVANRITTGVLKGGYVKLDLTRGTFLIGKNDDDYLLKFDGTKLKFGNGSIGSNDLSDELKTELKGKDGADGKSFINNIVSYGDFSRINGFKQFNFSYGKQELYDVWTVSKKEELSQLKIDSENGEKFLTVTPKESIFLKQYLKNVKTHKKYYYKLVSKGEILSIFYAKNPGGVARTHAIVGPDGNYSKDSWVTHSGSFSIDVDYSPPFFQVYFLIFEKAQIKSLIISEDPIPDDTYWVPARGKNDMLGEKGEPGEQGPPGKDGSIADLPESLKNWAGKATEISGKYVYTPELFVGESSVNTNYKTGIYIGKNVNVNFGGGWRTLSGLMGLKDGKVIWVFTTEGQFVLGHKIGEQIQLGADGRAIIPMIKSNMIETGAITTDILVPGSHERIILERGYNAGDNNCKQIDTTYDGLRLKANADTYINIRKSKRIDFYTDGFGASIYKSNWYETHPTGSASNSGSYKIEADNALITAGWVKTVAMSPLSDISLKENVKYLDSDFIYRENQEHKIDHLSVDDIMNFVKNARIATYDYKDFKIDSISVVAQNLLKFEKIEKYLVNKFGGKYGVNIYSYMSMLHVALQEEMKKNKEHLHFSMLLLIPRASANNIKFSPDLHFSMLLLIPFSSKAQYLQDLHNQILSIVQSYQ